METHINKKTFPCEKCGKKFDKPFYLKRHLNNKNPCIDVIVPNNICKWCNKTFSTKGNATKHMKQCKYVISYNDQLNALKNMDRQRAIIIDNLNMNPVTKNLNQANYNFNAITINNTNNNNFNPVGTNIKTDKVIKFCNAFKPEGIDMDAVIDAINYHKKYEDMTQDEYLEMEGRAIQAIWGDPNTPQNHTILAYEEMFMCNGLNGWICSNDKETLITKLREITRQQFYNAMNLTNANYHEDTPCNIRSVIRTFTQNIPLDTLLRDGVHEAIQKCEGVAFNTALDAADIVFSGANGMDNIRRLSQKCADGVKTSKLKPIGKRLHPRITFGQRIPMKNQITNLRNEDDVTNAIMNPVYPKYEFLKAGINKNPNYLSPDSTEWVLTKYETDYLKGSSFKVYDEIMNKLVV
jgi:hypothetical protein